MLDVSPCCRYGFHQSWVPKLTLAVTPIKLRIIIISMLLHFLGSGVMLLETDTQNLSLRRMLHCQLICKYDKILIDWHNIYTSPDRAFLVCFGSIQGAFGRAMVCMKCSRDKIHALMGRPKERDTPPKYGNKSRMVLTVHKFGHNFSVYSVLTVIKSVRRSRSVGLGACEFSFGEKVCLTPCRILLSPVNNRYSTACNSWIWLTSTIFRLKLHFMCRKKHFTHKAILILPVIIQLKKKKKTQIKAAMIFFGRMLGLQTCRKKKKN